MVKHLLCAGLAVGACYALFAAIPDEPPKPNRRRQRRARANHGVSAHSFQEMVNDMERVAQGDPIQFANLANNLLEAIDRSTDVAITNSQEMRLRNKLDQMQRKLGDAKYELRRNARGKGPCHQKSKSSDYLFPDERRYPVPTQRCARTALTYASWPNNLYEAPRVVARLKKTKWWFKPAIRNQAERLMSKYRRTFKKAA